MIASKLAARDAAREVWLDLKSRPGRSALTALGTLIGIAVLVSTLGLAASLAAQISSRFDALTATEVTVTTIQVGQQTASIIPADGPERALRINGTVAATTLSEIKDIAITGTPVYDPSAPLDTTMPLYAASPGLADVVHATLDGRFFDAWHDARAVPVAVLGYGAAERLRVGSVLHQPVVFINGQPVAVIGIISSLERRTGLAQAVIVPDGYARAKLGQQAPASLVIETRVGAAEVVADQVGIAIRPDQPERIATAVPPSPELTRSQISGDTQTLFIVLAVISLVIGGIGIANMTLVAVLERVPEIGLRRAIGARRRHIVTQFLAGSVVVGFIGGIAGTAVGLMVTAGVSVLQSWPPTLPWVWLVASPVLGALIGLLAGLYPAYRASRIEPIEALRTAQ